MKRVYKNMILVLAAFIWGTNFVCQSIGAKYLQPFIFNGIRFSLAFIFLVIIIGIRKIFKISKKINKNASIVGGLACGFLLFLGSVFQQIGIVDTSPGKAGFISVLYIVFVPIIAIFRGKMPKIKVWIAVSIAIIGMYFLCITETITIAMSDFYLIFSAIAYSFHIILIDKFIDKADPFVLNCMQSLITAILSLLFSSVVETNITIDFAHVGFPLLYAGIMSGGIAFLLQGIGQKNNDPSVASLFLSLESVFALVSSYFFLDDMLSNRELFGCLLIFTAILIVQINFDRKT